MNLYFYAIFDEFRPGYGNPFVAPNDLFAARVFTNVARKGERSLHLHRLGVWNADTGAIEGVECFEVEPETIEKARAASSIAEDIADEH